MVQNLSLAYVRQGPRAGARLKREKDKKSRSPGLEDRGCGQKREKVLLGGADRRGQAYRRMLFQADWFFRFGECFLIRCEVRFYRS